MASSSSSSANNTSNTTKDNRVAGSDRAIGISTGGDGDVQVHVVADEAFELAEQTMRVSERNFDTAADLGLALGNRAIRTVSDTLGRSLRDTHDALERTQEAARTESAQLAEQVIKFGIPTLAVVYVAGKMLK